MRPGAKLDLRLDVCMWSCLVWSHSRGWLGSPDVLVSSCSKSHKTHYSSVSYRWRVITLTFSIQLARLSVSTNNCVESLFGNVNHGKSNAFCDKLSCREDGNFLNHAKNNNVSFVAKSNFISLRNFVFDHIKTRPTGPLGEMRHDWFPCRSAVGRCARWGISEKERIGCLSLFYSVG